VVVAAGMVLGCGASAGQPADDAATDPATSVAPTTSTVVAPTTTVVTTTTAPPTTAPPTTAPPTTAPPTTVPVPILRTPAPEDPLRTLIMGDSTAFEVGHGVVRANLYGDNLLAPEVLYRVSSGLTRTDFFDWAYYLRFVMDTNPPEVLLLSLGANDGQDLTAPDGTIHLIHTDGWRAEYVRRVEEISTMISEAGTELYWIGQPLSRSEGHSAAMALISGAYREVAERHDRVHYIDIWSVLGTPDGRYRQEMVGPDGEPVEIRADDGIHLTTAGADLAAEHVLDTLRGHWGG